jgi:hypothetical protein
MPSRLNYISKKLDNNKRYYKSLKYPEIPLSANDLYVITTSGDRLDLLANEYYQDIRIPANVQGIIEAFEALNK